MTLSARGVHRNVPCTPVCDRKVDRMRTAVHTAVRTHTSSSCVHCCKLRHSHLLHQRLKRPAHASCRLSHAAFDRRLWITAVTLGTLADCDSPARAESAAQHHSTSSSTFADCACPHASGFPCLWTMVAFSTHGHHVSAVYGLWWHSLLTERTPALRSSYPCKGSRIRLMMPGDDMRALLFS